MKTIHKFTLDPSTVLTIPASAKVLTVNLQGGQPHLWIELDTDAPKIQRYFTSFGTGHEIDVPTKAFIGTIFFPDGFVFHVYEV